ncbi:hypothetical protein [Streptomyces sp. RK9]|uniref:hypothetical protein n=1 Tax=Streptomyces sp. RK9 TaxID=3239284 RepID=UPI00386FAEBF
MHLSGSGRPPRVGPHVRADGHTAACQAGRTDHADADTPRGPRPPDGVPPPRPPCPEHTEPDHHEQDHRLGDLPVVGATTDTSPAVVVRAGPLADDDGDQYRADAALIDAPSMNEGEIATSSHAERVFGVPAYAPSTARTGWMSRNEALTRP